MENREYLNQLFDIYKELLTKVEQDTFIEYYKEDLSLSEIASNRGISKSSVGKSLKQAEEKLRDYEDRLYILDKNCKIKEVLLKKDYDLIEKIINM